MNVTKKSSFDGSSKEISFEQAIQELQMFRKDLNPQTLHNFLIQGVTVSTEICDYRAHIPVISRPPAINDAIDILSSCYHEYDSEVAQFESTNWTALSTIDHAMAYLEREYTVDGHCEQRS